MKTKYVENDFCYLLSNFGNAKNPIFLKRRDVKNFEKRVKKHLSELCEILDFTFTNYEFQLLVSLKSREQFESFFLEKHDNQKSGEEIPDSTYILSQEMANLQSGYAKHFNYKYKRKGAVFARRFSKHLVINEEDLMNWKSRLDGFMDLVEVDWRWRYDYRNMVGIMGIRKIRINRRFEENGGSTDKILELNLDVESFILQGHFRKPSIKLRL